MSHRIARPRDVVLRKSMIAMIGLLAIMALVILDAPPVSANSTETYVVMPGDRLASVARRYCTTWEELYNLNRRTLGSNPDYLPAGTTIIVVNHCGSDWGTGGGGSGGVYDRGRSEHAQGTVSGSTYYVVRGDTIFSIANRFGVSQSELMRVNNLHSPYRLMAGQTLTIPGLGSSPPPSCTTPWLTIASPTSGANVQATFTVSGRGCGLFEGNVVVQARDSSGRVLAERPTTLQGSNVGAGGEGSYSVQLTVNVGVNTPGSIVVSSPGTTATATVPVIFNSVTSPPWLSIEYPTSGSNLAPTFTVSGRGAGLFEGNVVVQARDSSGRVLAERPTTLQGSTVGTGGEGSYSTQLTVNVGANTPGSIVVSSPGATATATVPVIFNSVTPPSWLSIEYPTSGSNLDPTFTVSGRGAGLFEGNVVVQARDSSGRVLAERPTTLQGSTVGTGGEGSYSVQLTVNVGVDTPGTIVAYSPGSSDAYATTSVRFNATISPSFIVIESPVNGALLPTTFTVSGRGGNLFEGNVVVQARDLNGRVLQQQATTLQGNNVGLGGEGVWSTQLTVNQSIDGRIVAFSSSPFYVEDSVSVRYDSGGGTAPPVTMKNFQPGECRVWPQSGAPAYVYPNGPQKTTFPGNQQFDAIRGVYTSGYYWYYVNMASGASDPFAWVRQIDLTQEQGVCTW